MKKEIRFALILAAGCLLSAMYLPWWSIAVVSAFAAYLSGNGRMRAFLISFAVTGVMFGLLAWRQNAGAGSDTVQMVSDLFMHAGVMNLCLVAGLIAGITSGLGAWFGASVRKSTGG